MILTERALRAEADMHGRVAWSASVVKTQSGY
jgi:hypothetical protein